MGDKAAMGQAALQLLPSLTSQGPHVIKASFVPGRPGMALAPARSAQTSDAAKLSIPVKPCGGSVFGTPATILRCSECTLFCRPDSGFNTSFWI